MDINCNLEQEFREVLRAAHSTTASEHQITEMRKLFYCGCAAALYRMNQGIEQSVLEDEIKEFRQEIRNLQKKAN